LDGAAGDIGAPGFAGPRGEAGPQGKPGMTVRQILNLSYYTLLHLAIVLTSCAAARQVPQRF